MVANNIALLIKSMVPILYIHQEKIESIQMYVYVNAWRTLLIFQQHNTYGINAWICEWMIMVFKQEINIKP